MLVCNNHSQFATNVGVRRVVSIVKCWNHARVCLGIEDRVAEIDGKSLISYFLPIESDCVESKKGVVALMTAAAHVQNRFLASLYRYFSALHSWLSCAMMTREQAGGGRGRGCIASDARSRGGRGREHATVFCVCTCSF